MKNASFRKLVYYAALFIPFVLALLIIEVFLFNFTKQGNKELKVWIETKECYGNCYSSDRKGYFPISLKASTKEKEKLRNALVSGNIDFLAEKTPYCIVYDCQKRREGFFSRRTVEVAIVGDSFVFGEGVKEEDTLGYLLSSKFSKANFKNYGSTGANIEGVFNIVSQVLEEKKIKDIIYFYNLNDILTSPEIAAKQKFIVDFQNIRWFNVKRPHNFFTGILSKSNIYHLVEDSIILHQESGLTIKNYLDMYFSPANLNELKRTINLLISMNNRSKGKGVNFRIVIYPLLYKDIFGRYPFVSIHEFLKDICKKNQIPCIDAYPAFEKYRSLKNFTVHPVDYHPNGFANKIVVEYLSQTCSSLQSYK